MLWSDLPTQTLNSDEVYEATLSTARFIADTDSTIVRTPVFGYMGIPFADFGDYSNIELAAAPSAADLSGRSLAYDDSMTPLDSIAQSIPTSSFQDENTQNALTGEFSMPVSSTSSNSSLDSSTSHNYTTSSSTFEELPTQDPTTQPTISTNPSPDQHNLATLTLYHSPSSSFSHSLPHPLSTPTIPFPSPYLNLLTPYQTGIISAFITNARVLSIARHELLTNSPVSPFYRPTNTSTSTTALMASLPTHYPPHLRPTLPQVLFRHHAYLDLLPFERLRERAIAWANTNPRLFDPRELKMDIVMGGLVCKRDEYAGGGGQPWDARSWTVAGWFRVKWRLLLC
ncbi:hypothetical protein ONS95_012553 [Cadophora gregata]|uniref:uncharacterized protein n=1 Tax=Cadophora gregata TaxID=51156 RepID=UPI0026DA79C1|nr:uncharacterized protein ONS95_012553 [Cadophora gregata]KAK0118252.1 hypothetical protein ONS95_012553 [Cadophora gregata]KAK0123325.1 hypothetical protein ONS96_010319 [Cadophora gregata f. sp. sojae]